MLQSVMMTKTFEELRSAGSFNAEQLSNMGALMEATLHVRTYLRMESQALQLVTEMYRIISNCMPQSDSVHCVRHWFWCALLSLGHVCLQEVSSTHPL